MSNKADLQTMAFKVTGALEVGSGTAMIPVVKDSFLNQSDQAVFGWFCFYQKEIFKILNVIAKKRWSKKSVISMVYTKVNHGLVIGSDENIELDYIAMTLLLNPNVQIDAPDSRIVKIARLAGAMIVEELELRITEGWQDDMPLFPPKNQRELGVAIHTDLL